MGVKEMKRHLKRAELELGKAGEQTRCGWCKKHITEAETAVKGIAEVSDATDATADVVRSKTESELRELGGKVGVLRSIVREGKGKRSNNNESIISQDDDATARGISLVAKKDATYIVGGSLLLGTGVGFGLNRLDQYYQPLGTQWYAQLGPLINVVGGAVLMGLAVHGKAIKKPQSQLFCLAGGATMLANGALSYLEGAYTQMSTAPTSTGAYRMNLPRPSAGRPPMPVPGPRPIGVMTPNRVTVPSY